MRQLNRVIAALTVSIAALACGTAPPPANAPAPGDLSGSNPPPAAGGARAQRPTIAAQVCESNGGMVVGDIGDGAIHRPEYRCADGALPTANIGPEPGGPIAIEGSVCCPKATTP